MRWTRDAVLFVIMIAGAFDSLVYTWVKWFWRTAKADLPAWRRVAAALGFVAVVMQAGLFIASWTRIGQDHVLFGQWARWVLPSFLVAVPLVLAGKGSSRWGLLSSSIVLFVVSFFIVLSA
jgi:hypothetical protein